MKAKIILSVVLSVGWMIATAQQTPVVANSMEEVLLLVQQNNELLKAGESQTEALKLQARTENNLSDPEVTYSHLWGNQEGMGFTGEFIASQSFDFPTLYAQRNKLNRERFRTFEAQQATLRQQILLQAEWACMDLIYLNQLQALLDNRLRNAEELRRFYVSQLEKGATNIIETNKIELELLNARNEARQNEAARVAKLAELKALNGGIAIEFTDSVYRIIPEYPEDFGAFQLEAVGELPEVNELVWSEAAAERQIAVAKNQWLPNLTMGYRMNPSSGGERFNGFIVGVSIPIFSNRNKVKQAKAERYAVNQRLWGTMKTQTAALHQLWTKAGELKKSIDEYSSVLEQQNSIELLNKAIHAGQLSMIEYFVNVTTFYQSMQNYLQLQNDYQKTMAEMYRFKL